MCLVHDLATKGFQSLFLNILVVWVCGYIVPAGPRFQPCMGFDHLFLATEGRAQLCVGCGCVTPVGTTQPICHKGCHLHRCQWVAMVWCLLLQLIRRWA